MPNRQTTREANHTAPRGRSKKTDAPRSPGAQKGMEILDEVQDLLPANWSIHGEGTATRAFQVLDSYDLSLLCAGKALLEFPGDPAGIKLLPEKEEYSVDASIDQSVDSLPSGPLKETVAKFLGAWKLTRQVEGNERVVRYRVFDEGQKGVARLCIRTFTCIGSPPITAAEVLPYRPYRDEANSLLQSIETLYSLNSVPDALLDSIPGGMRTVLGPLPKVHPQYETHTACVELMQYLLNRVRRYEPGIISDRDPEILHRYRVSIRRMRSIASLLKTAFPDEERKALETELKTAMQVTNRLRDLDVQTEEIAKQRSSLPGLLQPGVESIKRNLNAEREEEFVSVRKTLATLPFNERFANSTAVIAQHPASESEAIADALTAAISKRFRRIVREIPKLEKQSTPGQLHRLRVACKKLRYLIDLFPQLLNGDFAVQLLKRLKTLQDLLGRYNDLSVQEAFLLSQETRYSKDRCALMAIGALIMRSHRQRCRLVTRSIASAHKFCSAGTQRLVEGLMQRKAG